MEHATRKGLLALLCIVAFMGLLWVVSAPTGNPARAETGPTTDQPRPLAQRPKLTDTPTCCDTLNGSATATCFLQPGGLRDFTYSVTANNPCPYPVSITHFIYLEVSSDGVNFSFIARTSAETVVFQPG